MGKKLHLDEVFLLLVSVFWQSFYPIRRLRIESAMTTVGKKMPVGSGR